MGGGGGGGGGVGGHKEPAEEAALTKTLPDRHSQTSRGEKMKSELAALEVSPADSHVFVYDVETC